MKHKLCSPAPHKVGVVTYANLALWTHRQEDTKLRLIISYIVSLRTAWSGYMTSSFESYSLCLIIFLCLLRGKPLTKFLIHIYICIHTIKYLNFASNRAEKVVLKISHTHTIYVYIHFDCILLIYL